MPREIKEPRGQLGFKVLQGKEEEQDPQDLLDPWVPMAKLELLVLVEQQA